MTDRKIETANYFGGCPQCGKSYGYRNIGQYHWFFCKEHRTKWCAGFNFLKGWVEESPEQQDVNAQMLADYREVEPIMPQAALPTEPAETNETDAAPGETFTSEELVRSLRRLHSPDYLREVAELLQEQLR